MTFVPNFRQAVLIYIAGRLNSLRLVVSTVFELSVQVDYLEPKVIVTLFTYKDLTDVSKCRATDNTEYVRSYVMQIWTFLVQNCPTLKLNTFVRHEMVIKPKGRYQVNF